jgi:hypothetical protein
MKLNRIATSVAVIALGLTFAASASAQTGLSATPNPLTMYGPGGGYVTGFITVTNHGPGFASNLAVSSPINSGPKHGGLTIIADTCTGATLAQNGTCTVRFSYEPACFVRAGSQDMWQIGVSSSQFPVMVEQVIGNTTSNACQ